MDTGGSHCTEKSDHLPPLRTMTSNLSNPTTSLGCVAKICLCKIAVLRSSVTSVSGFLDAPNSLCLKTCAYKCRCRTKQVPYR